MPVVSMFYGIIVQMYFLDNRRHRMPHIHVRFQEHEAVLSIPRGTVIEGDIPPGKLRLVLAWVEIHRDELLADWELAVNGEPIFPIAPLQ